MIKFPTNNLLDIPTLRMDKQAHFCRLPLLGWGTPKLGRKKILQQAGTIHFYTDDYRFEHLWKSPDSILNIGDFDIVEPNFSVHIDIPSALAVWQIYRKRYLSRYWQDNGIQVWADLNVASQFWEINILGIPIGWKAFATRGYEDRIDALSFEKEIAQSIAQTDEFNFLVYGGGNPVKEWCLYNNAIHIDETMNKYRLEQQAKKLENNSQLRLSFNG